MKTAGGAQMEYCAMCADFVCAHALPFHRCRRRAAPALGNNHPCQNEGETKNLFNAKMFTGNDD